MIRVHRPLSALLVLLWVTPALAEAPAVDDPEDLAELATEQQPGVEALRARVQALEEVASVAKVWTDPMLMLELSNLPITAPWIDQHPMAGIQLKLQQRFPAPGQTRARAAAADARADAAGSEIASLLNRLRGQIRGRYEGLALVRQLRAVTLEHVAELDGLIESVQLRYQVGAANQHDLLQLQLRRDRLAETLPDLDARAEVLVAVLNGVLARDPSTPIHTPPAPTAAPLPGTDAERVEAIENHPALQSLRARAAAERAEADRARAEALPGPSAWLGYRIRGPQANGDPGTNLASVGVSVPLPAASTRRWNAMAGAAESRATAAEQRLASEQARLLASLAAAEARHARASDRAVAYRDSLEDAAVAALDSTRAAYQVDRAGFADLIRAEIALLDVKRQRLRAHAEAAAARAEILTLLGHSKPDGATP